VRLRLFVLASGLLACRPVPPTEADAPAVAPREPPTKRAEPDVPGAQAPAPPAEVVPVATPFPSDAVFVAPVVDVVPLVLFPDEGEAIRRRVVARLAELGHEVVPYEDLQRIEIAAAHGRLALEGDRTCRAPLTSREVADRYFAAAVVAEPEAACFGDCRLQVTFESPSEARAPAGLRTRAVRRPHDLRAWEQAIDSLDGGRGLVFARVGGVSGFSSHSPPIRIGSPLPFGPWARAPTGKVLRRVASQVKNCAHPDPAVGFAWEIRVAVTKTGRIARCFAASAHSQARTQDAECLCGFIETLRYPAGRPGRRLRVEAVDDGGPRRLRREFQPVQARTETWVTRLNEAPALSVCRRRGAAPPGTITIALDLQPDGAISGVHIDGDITTPASIAWAKCLVEELPEISLPCSPPGVKQLHLAYGTA
jgi:hypothetical protein